MSSVIVLTHERRMRRPMATQELGEETAKVVITAGKLLGVVTGIVMLTLAATTFIYATIIDSRLDRMELRMHEQFAARSETITRREYDAAQKGQDDATKRVQDRADALELRIKELETKINGERGR